jgi:hypothetical protein
MERVIRRKLANHILRRALAAPLELSIELLRRGLFTAKQETEFLRILSNQGRPTPPTRLGPVRFATLLAQGDTVLTARVVLRDLIHPKELAWLYRLLRFHESNEKCQELIRAVERALEGRKGNVRTKRR